MPSYVLHGAYDKLVPRTASAPVGKLPNVTRKVWPGLLHECLNEPEWPDVVAGITTWLDAQLSASG